MAGKEGQAVLMLSMALKYNAFWQNAWNRAGAPAAIPGRLAMGRRENGGR